MVGSKAFTSATPMTGLRHELVERLVRQFQLVRRLEEHLARTGAEELARIAQTEAPSSHHEMDPREHYRELTATPAHWVRLI